MVMASYTLVVRMGGWSFTNATARSGNLSEFFRLIQLPYPHLAAVWFTTTSTQGYLLDVGIRFVRSTLPAIPPMSTSLLLYPRKPRWGPETNRLHVLSVVAVAYGALYVSHQISTSSVRYQARIWILLNVGFQVLKGVTACLLQIKGSPMSRAHSKLR